MLAIITTYSFLSLIAILLIVFLLILAGVLAPKLGIGISLLGIFFLASLSFYQPAAETAPPAYGLVQFIDTTSSIPNPSPTIIEPPSSTENDPIEQAPRPKTPTTKPKDKSSENTLPQPSEAIPDSYESIFPPLNPHVKLQIKGIRDKDFIGKLGKHIGYQFARKGTFLIEVEFTGELKPSKDLTSGTKEWNYQEGSLVIKVDGESCIGKGQLILPQTTYSGKTLPELQADLEKRKLDLLERNIRQIVPKLRACIPH